MSLPTDPGARHREVAAGFTARVRDASDWDATAPVPGWRARDVVGHLVEWFPAFLETGTGLTLDRRLPGSTALPIGVFTPWPRAKGDA